MDGEDVYEVRAEGPAAFDGELALMKRVYEAYALARREVFDHPAVARLSEHQVQILVELESAEMDLARFREERRRM